MTGEKKAGEAVNEPLELDVLVVGAGFAGIYGVYRYRSQGLTVKCVEAAADIGGVWYHNRYPGARCDVPSIEYSYSFCPEVNQQWRWSHRYAEQPEILDYIHFVADRLDIRKDILLENRVVSARWNADAKRWLVETDKGNRFACRFLVLCTGALSSPKVNDFPGLADFEGEWYQTSKWPHEPVSFEGKRVGVFGTGASGTQAIPVIARAAKHLTVFQRTAQYSLPARNRPLEDAEIEEARTWYPGYWDQARSGFADLSFGRPGKPFAESSEAEGKEEFESRWEMGGLSTIATYSDLLVNQEANDVVAHFFHDKIHEIVKDSDVAKNLCPDDHPLGTRRVALDTNYYETFNRDNVTLVNVRTDPLVKITTTGVRTQSGDHPLDMIIFATGFDAFTGAIKAMDIRNASGEHIMDRWANGPKTYLGTAVSGFPNLFIVTGPGGPSVLSNCIIAGEVDVDWIGDCIAWLDSNGYKTIEAEAEAEAAWARHVAEAAEATLLPKANSWYMGANIPGKPRVFLPYIGGLGNFYKICKTKAAADYEGFIKA